MDVPVRLISSRPPEDETTTHHLVVPAPVVQRVEELVFGARTAPGEQTDPSAQFACGPAEGTILGALSPALHLLATLSNDRLVPGEDDIWYRGVLRDTSPRQSFVGQLQRLTPHLRDLSARLWRGLHVALVRPATATSSQTVRQWGGTIEVAPGSASDVLPSVLFVLLQTGPSQVRLVHYSPSPTADDVSVWPSFIHGADIYRLRSQENVQDALERWVAGAVHTERVRPAGDDDDGVTTAIDSESHGVAQRILRDLSSVVRSPPSSSRRRRAPRPARSLAGQALTPLALPWPEALSLATESLLVAERGDRGAWARAFTTWGSRAREQDRALTAWAAAHPLAAWAVLGQISVSAVVNGVHHDLHPPEELVTSAAAGAWAMADRAAKVERWRTPFEVLSHYWHAAAVLHGVPTAPQDLISSWTALAVHLARYEFDPAVSDGAVPTAAAATGAVVNEDLRRRTADTWTEMRNVLARELFRADERSDGHAALPDDAVHAAAFETWVRHVARYAFTSALPRTFLAVDATVYHENHRTPSSALHQAKAHGASLATALLGSSRVAFQCMRARTDWLPDADAGTYDVSDDEMDTFSDESFDEDTTELGSRYGRVRAPARVDEDLPPPCRWVLVRERRALERTEETGEAQAPFAFRTLRWHLFVLRRPLPLPPVPVGV